MLRLWETRLQGKCKFFVLIMKMHQLFFPTSFINIISIYHFWAKCLQFQHLVLFRQGNCNMVVARSKTVANQTEAEKQKLIRDVRFYAHPDRVFMWVNWPWSLGIPIQAIVSEIKMECSIAETWSTRRFRTVVSLELLQRWEIHNTIVSNVSTGPGRTSEMDWRLAAGTRKVSL